jgi:hypothetical protein
VSGPFSTALFGLGVDADGNVWMYDESGNVTEFNPSGNLLFHFNTEHRAIPAFAVDSNDNSYPSREFGAMQFDSTGHEVGFVDKGIAPVALATDLSTDEVYVDEGTALAEYSPARELLLRFGGPELGSGGPGGIAVNPITGTIYAANVADAKVFVYRATPGPRVSPQAASSLKATTATLNATVNPEGLATTYQFEYGTSTSYRETAPVTPAPAGSGSSFVPASTDVSELEGGTLYHYRIAATNAAGTVYSADRHFTTLTLPVIDSVTATGLGTTLSDGTRTTFADLNTRIDPKGLQTTYHFEYGTSTAYGTSVPALPGEDIGAGNGDVVRSEHITGLEENRTYHYRVVASNVNGTTTGSDHTFVYDTSGEGLPDHRAYEMVTPVQKNGALMGISFLDSIPPAVAADGSRVMSASIQCFAGAGSCVGLRGLIGSLYEFERTNDGWQATALSPSTKQFNGVTGESYDANTGAAIFNVAEAGGHEHLYERKPDGSFLDVGPVSEHSFPGEMGREVFATADLSHLVWYEEHQPWVSLDPNDLGESGEFFEYVGAGKAQPELVAVNGGLGSTNLISACGTMGYEVGGPGSLSEDGHVFYLTTLDAKEVCPAAAAASSPPVHEVFARVDNGEARARLVPISEPTATSNCTTEACLANTGSAHVGQFRDAEFNGAAANGSKVFFSSTQQLTDSATEDPALSDTANGTGCNTTNGLNGCNLYESECQHCQELSESEEQGRRRLVDVSAGEGGPVPGGPRVRGVVAVSSDGSHVYFVAQGVLAAGANGQGQTARDGADNMYVFERDATEPQGQVRFVVTLPGSDTHEWRWPTNVTPDGRFLVFESHARLTADDTSVSGALQVFRYDAQTGQLVRISVGNDGFNDNGNSSSATPCGGENGKCAEDARVASGIDEHQNIGSPRRDSTMSDNGQFVFFQSPVGLTPHALNDVQIGVEPTGNTPEYAQNVYEWHEGHVYLISDGRDVAKDNGQTYTCAPDLTSVCLLGADSTGANVFFSTADKLVPQDTDTQLDYYDARICEPEEGNPCISPAAPPLPPCLGEVCHGTPAGTPSLQAPGSASFNGQGNTTPAPALVKPRSATRLRAEKLAKALKVCKRERPAKKRAACEKSARKKYGAQKARKSAHANRRTK